MGRHFYLSLFLIILAINNFAFIHAGEVTNYTESFSGLSTSKNDFAPISWGHIVESYTSSYVPEYVVYSVPTTGGKAGSYLKAGTQTLGDYENGFEDVNDLLITPLVKGSISFYAKKASNSGTLKLFTCTKSDMKFTKGNEIIFDLPALSTSAWTLVTIALTDSYSFIGIRLDNMCIDEFSATNANIEDIKAVEITSTTLLSPSKVYADENGLVSIHASFQIKNSGNVSLLASEYSFQMEKRSNPVTVMTPVINGSKDLAVGEIATIEAICQYTLADKTAGDWVAYDIRERLGNTTKQLSYIEVIGYVAELDIKDAGGSVLVTPVDFEMFKGQRSISVTLKNKGGAPLVMKGVNLPVGFSIDETSFTIPVGQSISKTITLGGDASVCEGNIEFLFDGKGTKSFAVKGTVIAQDSWFENFENGLPANWIIPSGSNWSVASDIITLFSKKYMVNSVVDPLTPLISPKVTVSAGDILTFSAARQSQYTIPVIQVRYSSDRQKWSTPIAISMADALPASEKGFKTFMVNSIPVGDYYISFEAGYIALDNVHGFKLATTDHDLYFKSFKTQGNGTVNHPVEVTADITNMIEQIEVAGSYTVKLEENGKTVAEITSKEHPAKETLTYCLSYTPHTVGSHSLKVIASANGSDYFASSAESEIMIAKEIAADAKIIGTPASNSTSVPLRLNYKNTLSETVYTKAQLELASGSEIVKIAYPYFSTASLATNITVWLENTEDSSPSTSALADTTRMTKVFNSPYTFIKGGTATELILAEFAIPDGFVYTGNNLRVIVKSGAITYSNGFSFGYDPTITNTTTYKFKDLIADFPAAALSTFTSGLPVIHLLIAKSVPSVSGRVTSDQIAVAGASVSLTSGDIIYQANTDESGVYSIPVYQPNKEYTLSCDKIGYVVTASKLVVPESGINEQNITLEATGATLVDANNIIVSSADKSVALQGEGWTAEKIASLSAALGNNTVITGIDMSHINIPADVTATFGNINPNCLIYVKKNAVTPETWANVVRGNKAEAIALQDKAPFCCVKPFTVENISYLRVTHTATQATMSLDAIGVMETLCLPFTMSVPTAVCSVQEYTGSIDSKVSFTTVATPTILANVPYLITVNGDARLILEAENVEITPAKTAMIEKGDYTYCGVFAPITDEVTSNCYVFDGNRFQKAEATEITPFRAYFRATGGVTDVPSLSIDIDGEGDGFTVTLKVTAVTGENLANTSVEMEHVDYGIIYPTVFLSDKGECVLKNILKGTNQLSITRPGLLKYINSEVVVYKDTTLNIVLQEAVRKPYALKTEMFHNVYTGQTDVSLSWNKETDYFFDDFENYEGFSIDFAPWTGIDGDKAATAQLSGSYPNSGLSQYATIFNPLTITPPVWYEYPVLRPSSGKQYAAFIRTANGSANNDWLITPKIKVGVNNVVRFLAKAGDVYKEQFKVLISTTGTDTKDFKALTPGNYEQVDYRQWVNIQYDLSAYEDKDIHIAIQYMSKAYFMLMVDDFYVGPQNIEPSKLAKRSRSAENPSEKFVVYCDNDSVDTVTETSYLFKKLSSGNHTFSVKAVYKVSQSEVASISATVPDATDYVGIRINLTTNNGASTDGFLVNYVNRSTGKQLTDTIKGGISELKSLPKAQYLVNISPEGYENYTQTVTVDKNITLDVLLKELIISPSNITSDLTPVEGKTNVLLKWNQDLGFSEGFEDYPDFSQTLGEWTTVDIDKMPPYGISLGDTEISFPGVKQASACMVFNAKSTTPSMEADGAILAPEGDKCIIFFSAQSGQSNDWLITPIQKVRDGYFLRFLAKSYSGMYPETFEIGVSNKKEIETFSLLDEIVASDTWVQYEVDLSAYAGQEVYLAIHYKSFDKFMLLMDSFYIGPKEENSSTAIGNATYEIWLNGVKKTTSKENSYLFRGLEDGTYTAGIKAVYATGASEIIEHTFICNASFINEKMENDLCIYGNKGFIRISLSREKNLINVYTTTGQALYSVEAGSGTFLLPISPGVYIVKVSNSEKEVARKVVVN